MSLQLENLALSCDRLRCRVDPSSLPFTTTADLAPLSGTTGQQRAFIQQGTSEDGQETPETDVDADEELESGM